MAAQRLINKTNRGMNMTAEGEGKKGIMLSDQDDNKSGGGGGQPLLPLSDSALYFSCPGLH